MDSPTGIISHMRQIFLIGIGAGDPQHLTLQAIEAMQAVDVFFFLDKREETHDLIAARQALFQRHARPDAQAMVLNDPPRAQSPNYHQDVQHWHEQRAERLEEALMTSLSESGVGALLVWGEPSIYDSAMRLMRQIEARGQCAIQTQVIPGISSIQALAAAFAEPLNRIGEPIHITTGRALKAGFPADLDAVVVMLDGECSFTHVMQPEMEIFWGAYLGTPDQLLIQGPVMQVADEIITTRQQARARHGWIMDTYLLRRPLRLKA